MAGYDVEWGERPVPYWLDNPGDQGEYMEHFLSLGLNWLQQVVMASTYKERYELLAPSLAADRNFLDKALSEHGLYMLTPDAMRDDLPLSELGEIDRSLILPKPIMVDPDSGPEDIWFWAFADITPAYTYYKPEHENYRKRGYVMFDYDRLCKWDAFHPPFDRSAITWGGLRGI